MIKRDNCVYCSNQSEKLGKFQAKVSPFIENYALNAAAPRVNIVYCPRCEGSFFDHAYDDKEMSNLYREYRGKNYTAVRERYEKGYSAVNDLLGNDPGEVISRKNNLQKVLLSVISGHNIKVTSVLDWGGDVGQFIPELPGAKKFLYDMSGKEPCRPDITGLTRIPEGMRFDLILSCHVFEHVSSPVDTLMELKGALNEGGIVYLEVPYEFPKLHRLISSFLKRNLTVLMHEHINQFSVRSLLFLANRAGFEVLAISLPKTNIWAISAVLRKTSVVPSGVPCLPGLALKEHFLSFLRFLSFVKANIFNAGAYKAVFGSF